MWTAIDFCPQLVRAILQATKTVTFKPLTAAEVAIVNAGGTPTCPWGSVGDGLFVAEIWGMARGAVIYRADLQSDGFRSRVKLPVGYMPDPEPTTAKTSRIRLLMTVAPRIVPLARATEDAARIVNAPSEGRTTHLDELMVQWNTSYHGRLAWNQNPLCWRLEFTRI